MKTNTEHDTTRRAFLETCTAGLGAAGLGLAIPLPGNSAVPVSSPGSVWRVEADPKRSLVTALSWDTEGGARLHSNLLRKGSGVGLRVRSGGQWREDSTLPASVQTTDGHTLYRLEVGTQSALEWSISGSTDRLEMIVAAKGREALPPKSVELVFPFDPMVTPTTVLPSRWREDGGFDTPIVISAPDFGQMLVRVTPAGEVTGRLEGSRDNHIVDLVLEFPQLDANRQYKLSFSPVTLAPPKGLQDEALWRQARRGWFNAFQPSARWGEQNRPFSAPPGVLANNVLSDPCSFSLIFYADHMLWTPVVAEGISVAELVRHSIEFWLEQRTHMTGEVVGYWDYANFLEANAGPVICAWDYVEATGNRTWLEKIISRLEFVAEFAARRDQDFDGLVEATQSGNANTFFEPDRSSNWFDAVNYGHKDAYANAVIYRSWRCLEDLEAQAPPRAKARALRPVGG